MDGLVTTPMHTKIAQFFFVITIGILSAFGFAVRADAATITFRSSSVVVHQGQEIAIEVLVDPAGEIVNTVGATIVIPKDLDFVGADDSSSFVGLWVDEPKFNPSTRTLLLSGIVPGGFSGLIDPFSPAEYQPGTLIRLILRGRTAGAGIFSLPEAEVYLNDGFGTETRSLTGSMPLVVDELLQEGSLDFFPDTTPPLEFTATVERDILLYENKRVLIFNTKDKGSGMDHYEVKEGNSSWVIATSPYLLKDQSMQGDILVKAVDRDGNERIIAIPSANPLNEWQIFGLIIVFILLFVLTGRRIAHYLHKRDKKNFIPESVRAPGFGKKVK
jgi:hypothetical protein